MTWVRKPTWVSDLGIDGYRYGYNFCVPTGTHTLSTGSQVSADESSHLVTHHFCTTTTVTTLETSVNACFRGFQLTSAHHRHQHLSTGHHHCKIGGHSWHFNAKRRAILMQRGGYKVTRCALHFFISFYILTLSPQTTFWMCWGGFNPPRHIVLLILMWWGRLDPPLSCSFHFDLTLLFMSFFPFWCVEEG